MKRIAAKVKDYLSARSRGMQISLVVAVCLIYLPFLSNPFIFDDVTLPSLTEEFANLSFNFRLRWFAYASLAWTTAIFSDVFPHMFRLGNMLIHAGSVIALFFLLRELVGDSLPEIRETPGVKWGAWFGALVFACHPLAVYAVGYVVQRSILMATLFVLIMQWAYLRSMLSGKKLWLTVALAAYFLACFSKEHSVFAPAVLAAMTILLSSKNRLSLRILLLTGAAFSVIGILVILRAKGVFGATYEVMAPRMFAQQGIVENTSMLHLLSVMTQAGLFFKYLLLWLIPNPVWMSLDMREQFVQGVISWQGWLGLSGFILYGMFAFRLLLKRGGKGLMGWALLYPWLQFLLEFSSIRVQEPFVLYRSYIWMPGMMLFFPLLLNYWAKGNANRQFFSRAKDMNDNAASAGHAAQQIRTETDIVERQITLPGWRMLLVLGCGVALLMSLSWQRLWIFADNYRVWNEAAQLLPNEKVAGADRIFYNRGTAQLAAGKWDEAISDLQKVVKLSPGLAPVHSALGMAYFNAGQYSNALAQFDTVIKYKPDDAQAYLGKGLTLKRLRKDTLAKESIVKSCDLKNMSACMIATKF